MQDICVVFDITPHEIKLIVFNTVYEVVDIQTAEKAYISDEKGRPCENLEFISEWVKEHINTLNTSSLYKLKAVNFTCYANTLVHLDGFGKPVLPLYAAEISLGYNNRMAFIEAHGAEDTLQQQLQIPEICFESGALQLFWIKQTMPEVFRNLKYSVSLTQYLQSLYTKKYFSEYSQIGCYSGAWDFRNSAYHNWLTDENLGSLMLPLAKPTEAIEIDGVAYGMGIYSKVAALQPILSSNSRQFVMLSTGLWTTCLNPYNRSAAGLKDIHHDSMNILDALGKPIRLARLFSGDAHTREISYLSEHFNALPDFYENLKYDPARIRRLRRDIKQVTPAATDLGLKMDCPFMERNINVFNNVEDAYNQFVMDLIAQQIASINLTFDHQINRKIFVDGSLADNEIFMELLAEAFHDKAVYKIEYPHTSALGAALVIGKYWNTKYIDPNILNIKLIE